MFLLSPRFAVLTAILLGGCAIAPLEPAHPRLDLPLPTAWSTELDPLKPASTAELAQWWRQFGDAQLDQLIEEALRGSLDLRVAQARLRQARASRAQAVSGWFPSVSLSGGVNRSQREISSTNYDVGFDAAWEIDIFGGKQRGIEAATADAAATEANWQQARVSLIAEVAQNYIEVRAYQRRAALTRDNLANQSETLQITTWRYQAGLATASEVERARASREQTRASLPDLAVGLTEAENRLAVLLGRAPGSLHEMLAQAGALPVLPDAIASGIPADVLRQRPDLIAAEATLAAETARLGQKLAQRFPSLNLGASFGWQAYQLADLGGTLTRAVSGVLAATLFDGGKLRSAVAIQTAVQEQALLAYQRSVLLALEEVENALFAYAAGRERVAARQAAAEAAGNAARLSSQLYQAGLTDFQTILETERTRLSAEDALVSAEAGLCSSLIKLYKALGGGWVAVPAPTRTEGLTS